MTKKRKSKINQPITLTIPVSDFKTRAKKFEASAKDALKIIAAEGLPEEAQMADEMLKILGKGDEWPWGKK